MAVYLDYCLFGLAFGCLAGLVDWLGCLMVGLEVSAFCVWLRLLAVGSWLLAFSYLSMSVSPVLSDGVGCCLVWAIRY